MTVGARRRTDVVHRHRGRGPRRRRRDRRRRLARCAARHPSRRVGRRCPTTWRGSEGGRGPRARGRARGHERGRHVARARLLVAFVSQSCLAFGLERSIAARLPVPCPDPATRRAAPVGCLPLQGGHPAHHSPVASNSRSSSGGLVQPRCLVAHRSRRRRPLWRLSRHHPRPNDADRAPANHRPEPARLDLLFRPYPPSSDDPDHHHRCCRCAGRVCPRPHHRNGCALSWPNAPNAPDGPKASAPARRGDWAVVRQRASGDSTGPPAQAVAVWTRR